MTWLVDKRANRENERLIGEIKAADARFNLRQILASFLASLMSLSSGTVIAGWTPNKNRHGHVTDDNDLERPWTEEQESWIVSVYVIGALIGALPAGRLSQKYGPKTFLLWLALPMTFGWIVCMVYLDSLWMQCLGRFLCGLSLGATTVVVPLYCSDVSSDILRGRTGVFLDFMLCVGIQYAYVARTVLAGLPHFCVACIVVPFVFVLLFSYMPESPVHLYKSGRYEEAVAELRWLRGKRFNVKNEFDRIERNQLNHDIGSHLGSDGKTFAKNKRFFVKVWVISVALVLAQRLSGAGGVVQYSVTLFNMSGAAFHANESCIIVGTFQLAASGLAFVLIDRVGRRTLLLISSLVVTVCLMLMVIYFSLLAEGSLEGSAWKMSVLFILCIFVFGFRVGLGPVPWFIVTELVPAEYGAGRVQSRVAAFSWSLSFIIMKTFKTLVEQYPVQLWSTFTAFSAVGLVFIALFVPETNNRSREQIRIDIMDD